MRRHILCQPSRKPRHRLRLLPQPCHIRIYLCHIIARTGGIHRERRIDCCPVRRQQHPVPLRPRSSATLPLHDADNRHKAHRTRRGRQHLNALERLHETRRKLRQQHRRRGQETLRRSSPFRHCHPRIHLRDHRRTKRGDAHPRQLQRRTRSPQDRAPHALHRRRVYGIPPSEPYL